MEVKFQTNTQNVISKIQKVINDHNELAIMFGKKTRKSFQSVEKNTSKSIILVSFVQKDLLL